MSSSEIALFIGEILGIIIGLISGAVLIALGEIIAKRRKKYEN